MTETANSNSGASFRDRVVASGLVEAAIVDEAVALVRAEAANHASPPGETDDERLADKLVELGHLNRWQAGQLLRGRVRFTLGPYRIIDALGQGGMGQVFKGEHTVMKRLVAVKVLPRQKSTPDAMARFRREIQAQAQLDHPNLVRALDAGHDGNVDYLVTEYVRGADLRRIVRTQGKMGMAEAASIIWQAAHGLAHAHAKGLIHRDIKPGNLLVTPEGLTKISDLGLVGFFTDEGRTDLEGRKIVGTADYLSPEQITSPESLTPASDIYSLGCTLYYAVTGKVPYPGGSVRDKARAHLNSQPLDPRRLNPTLDDEFVDLIADMMAKDVAMRIQTAEEVIARIAPWVRVPVPVAAATILQTAHPPLAGFPPSDSGAIGLPPGSSASGVIAPPDSSRQRTEAVDQATEETVPMFEVDTFRSSPRLFGLPLFVAIALLALMAGAATILAVSFARLLFG